MLVQWFWPVVVCVSLLGSWSLGSKFSWHLPCSISQFLMIYEDCLACTDPLHVATLILRSKETFLVTATELSENKSSQISLEIRKCRHWRKIKTGLWPHDNVSNLLIVWQKRLKIEVFRVALSFLWDHVNFSHERWRDLYKITTSVPLQRNALLGYFNFYMKFMEHSCLSKIKIMKVIRPPPQYKYARGIWKRRIHSESASDVLCPHYAGEI